MDIKMIKKVVRQLLGPAMAQQLIYLSKSPLHFPYIPYLKSLGSVRHSQAQFLQDIVALSFLDRKQNGFFIEIGAGNGVNLSNTYLFEKHLGWNGLLCEPHPDFIGRIRDTRTAALETRAVWNKSGMQVDFACVAYGNGASPELSTIREYADSDFHDRRNAAIIKVETISAADLFHKHEVPAYIDFMSIDTEGSELDILKNLPFNRHSFGFIAVEHNNREAHKREIARIMTQRGYSQVLEQASNVDSWFVPKERISEEAVKRLAFTPVLNYVK